MEQIQKEKSKKVVSTKNGRIMLLSKCSVYNHNKLKFLKGQEDKWSISKLTGVKVSILFNSLSILNVFLRKYKMNAIINKFLLAGDRFMSEMRLKQSHFTYSACGPFTRNKGRIKKFKKIRRFNIDTFIRTN